MLNRAAFDCGRKVPSQSFALYVYLMWRFRIDALKGIDRPESGSRVRSAPGGAFTMRIPFSTLLDWTSLTPAEEAFKAGDPGALVTGPAEKALEWLTDKGLLSSWDLRDGRGDGERLGGHGDGMACGLSRLLGIDPCRGNKTKAACDEAKEAWLVFSPAESFTDNVLQDAASLREWSERRTADRPAGETQGGHMNT